MLLSELSDELDKLQSNSLLRKRRVIESPQAIHIEIDGKSYLSFASNDYLGLASHPELISAAQQGAKTFGVGAGASHLVCGHSTPHHILEQALANFVNMPQALLFSSGYMANIGAITALVGPHDEAFADKLNHASLNDSILLSRARFHRYRHLDLAQLENLLAASHAKRKLIVTDAVFSMDGDIAPVPQLLELCERYDAFLLLDDAHGFGVLGSDGSGTPAHFDVRSPRLLYMATLGKAAGVSGAFLSGPSEVIQFVMQRARTYIYTTAMPPLLAHTLTASLELLERADRRARLQNLIATFTTKLRLKSWKLLPSQTAIQALVIGDNAQVLKVHESLFQQGILVPAIRPPTVPKHTARLRISLSAAHSTDDVLLLIDCLHQLQ